MPRMHSNNVCSVFCRHGKRQHVFRCIFFFSTPPLPPPAYPVMLFCGCEKGGGPPHLKHIRTLYQGVAAQKAAQHCRGAASSSIYWLRDSHAIWICEFRQPLLMLGCADAPFYTFLVFQSGSARHWQISTALLSDSCVSLICFLSEKMLPSVIP